VGVLLFMNMLMRKMMLFMNMQMRKTRREFQIIHTCMHVCVCLPKFKVPQGTVTKHHSLILNYRVHCPGALARGQNNKHFTAHRERGKEGRREGEREGENASLQHPLACISIHTGILFVSFDLAFPTCSSFLLLSYNADQESL
jgi:hypothetical protein